MKILVEVSSAAYDSEYGGEQLVPALRGEYLMDEIFRLPFFRLVVDEVIEDAVCFRLKEGAQDHYFVLEGIGDTASFTRDTSIGSDSFYFTLADDSATV
ncbi:MAG: hypothetical protein ACI4MC_05605 [Candidatus Coproplasma sp.]